MKNEINDLINKLKENIEFYNNKSKKIIKQNENRNYKTLNGINEFINYDKEIINDIKK